MRTIEQQIQAAISSLRSKGQTTTDALSVRNLASQSMSFHTTKNVQETLPQEEALSQDENANANSVEPRQEAFPRVLAESTLVEQQMMLHKPGVLSSQWRNDYIHAALPILLLSVNGNAWEKTLNGLLIIRSQMVREIQYFQEILLKKQYLPEDVDHLSYLLCTYVDEVFALSADFNADVSLLVQFHGDSWGGENCFEHLAHYMEKPEKHEAILQLYDFVLSLGLKGKFHLIERGDVLLTDLRNQLNTLLYAKNPTKTLAYIEPVTGIRKKAFWLTPLRLMCVILMLALLVYGIAVWLLHQKSQMIRQAILAWEPPVLQKVNVTNTIPQLLKDILDEGWLEIREDPQGWLLIFTSDGAFHIGKSELTEEFKAKRNIERLGNALAPWPGDLEIIGHTDNMPFRASSNGTNEQLSKDRARVVADKLREGTRVNSEYQRQILTNGKGEFEPIADNKTVEGRRKNRRVDILWKTKRRDFVDAVNHYHESEFNNDNENR